MKLSEFLNNHIHQITNDTQKTFLGLGTIPMQNVDFAIQSMCKPFNYCFALENLGLKVEFSGSGKVKSQSLKAGQKLSKNQKIILQLS